MNEKRKRLFLALEDAKKYRDKCGDNLSRTGEAFWSHSYDLACREVSKLEIELISTPVTEASA